MAGTDGGGGYQPLSLAELGELMAGTDERSRWRLIAEFLEEYRWEPVERHASLLEQEPDPTGDEHWDVFLWSRRLRQFWFPFNTRAARVDAIVTAPAAFRSRGVFVSAGELGVA